MTITHIKPKESGATHLVRVLSPLGFYPKQNMLFEPYTGYLSQADLAFSVLPIKNRIHDEYNELRWLEETELRIYSAIALAIDPLLEGMVTLYPFLSTFHLRIENISLEPDQVSSLIQSAIKEQVPKCYWGMNAEKLQLTGAFPASNNPPYKFTCTLVDQSLAQKLYDSIDLSDGILVRGLSALIKSNMLKSHPQFVEDSVYILYVALEVSYRLVLRKLKERGFQNPSSRDAMTYIHDAFHDTERAEGYFEDYYSQRIMAMHPESNKYGVNPFPIALSDDFYDLYDALIEVYRFLLCGFIHPKHLEKVNAFHAPTH